MIRGLTKVSWERVDVDFRGTKQRFLAHNTIQASSFLLSSLPPLRPYLISNPIAFQSLHFIPLHVKLRYLHSSL